MLRTDVVADPHTREIRHSGGRRRVVRRGRETATDLIDGDDEILVRVERVTTADKNLLDDLVGSRIPGRNQDRVVLGPVESAECRVGKLAIADRAAFLQFETTNIMQFVRAVVFLELSLAGNRKFEDSPLERNGFEIPVPGFRSSIFY